MSAEPLSPPEPGAGSDGFGPNSLGHRIPVIRTPGKIAAQVARLTMGRGSDPPYMPPEKLEALLAALAERYAAARERRESVEITVRARIHDGRHKALGWSEQRSL